MATAALATAIITSIFTVDGRETAPPAPAFHARPPAVLEEQPALPPSPPRSTGIGTGMGAGCSSGPVHDLIVSYDWNDADALAIASRESGCNPYAKNASSSASGVFQLMSFWWDGSNAYGWVFDPFDAAANVAHAFLMWQADGGSFCPGQWCV